MKDGRGISTSDHAENQWTKSGGQDFIKNKKKMKKNMQRLGGKGGLSLESFANAKTRNDNYNPSLIKKQREFYRNAKYVGKYKRLLRQHEQTDIRSREERQRPLEEENETKEGGYKHQLKKGPKNSRSIGELYERKHEEDERVRLEREATIRAKNEERSRAQARRKDLKEKMFKKTKSGQPVMKYRIEHLLETIQGPTF